MQTCATALGADRLAEHLGVLAGERRTRLGLVQGEARLRPLLKLGQRAARLRLVQQFHLREHLLKAVALGLLDRNYAAAGEGTIIRRTNGLGSPTCKFVQGAPANLVFAPQQQGREVVQQNARFHARETLLVLGSGFVGRRVCSNSLFF